MRSLFLLAALPCLAPAQGPGRLPPWEAKAFHLLHPPAGGMKYRQVPWHTDLAPALKEAKEEKRPLFLWVAGDPPLERC